MSQALLPILLLLSGFCGISYEILYAKLLGNLLGDQFTISASVLLTFLLGIGVGTLLAHRFVNRLWLIEAGIGLYAACMVASQGWVDRLLYAWVPELGTSMLACMLVSVALLALPAFLVGCSVPIFAAYLGTVRSSAVFSVTYGVYNFGAALTALVLEFLLLRAVGLRAATLWLAALNGLVAVGLLLLMRSAPIVPAPVATRLRFDRRELIALALGSVASAVFQLLMIKLAECIFGPFHETFSLVLATVLLGLALGSLLVGRVGLSFEGALLTCCAGTVGVLALLPLLAHAYAALYPLAVLSYPLLISLKLTLVLVLMGLPAIGFGATIPALLRRHRDIARESGELLFVSSMANVAGFALMAFVLHRQLDYGPILLVVCVLAAAGIVFRRGPRARQSWTAAGLVALAIAAQQGLWREALLYYGHESFHSSDALRQVERIHFSAEKFRGYQDIFAITRIAGEPYFFINGYISIPLSSAAEKIVGALSCMLSPRTDEALVLGVGSGATAATVGLIFEHTDAVEINPAVVANLDRMSRYNFDITHRPRMNIVHDDGIHFVKTTDKRYSLILNTVTTPLYFSSSKLYTRDFLEDVSAKLTPDGLYTTWVDNKIGDDGIDIILQTLDTVFDECWLSYLRSAYYLLACSNQPIGPRQLEAVTGNAELRRYLAEQHDLSVDLLPYSVIATRAETLRSRGNAPLNTLDLPVLEHEMARLRSRVSLGRFTQRLTERLSLREVEGRMAQALDWSPAAFQYFADLRLDWNSSLAQGLRAAVRRQFGDISREYERVALEHAEAIGTEEAFHRASTRLYKREAYEAAAAALRRAVEIDPDSVRSRYDLGRAYEILKRREQAREAYLAVLQRDAQHSRAIAALERLDATPGAAAEIDVRAEPEPEDDADRD